MTKEEFSQILERQQLSGLSIKDFCENETYPASSFHYWKSKYGFSRPYGNNHKEEYPLSPIRLTSGSVPSATITNQVEIEFPGGIKVRLNNFTDLHTAGSILTQTLLRHVLPE